MANKAELFVLSVIFLVPCVTIVAQALKAPSLFAVHPAANAVGFLFFMPGAIYAMAARKGSSDHQTRILLTKVHMVFQLLTLVCMSVAGACAYMTKETYKKPHFTSTHSWVAGATSTLFTLNLLGGLGTTFAGKTNYQWKNPGHRIGGLLTTVLGAAAAVYGIYSGSWGKTQLGESHQFNLSVLTILGYLLLIGKAIVTKPPRSVNKQA
ncbi:TPA: hypothetical protein N0F65_006682 [Lagenidium giganteum]|uniref:Cytochrome b561 domain-containing protein n=1 Tax=Lagenidium giganteum TaxID=4803 RepID=A0AAV2Z994_9STRA|nr:TPA: hypothetical protein N0F65_006682 [Lagenidium giganteum]